MQVSERPANPRLRNILICKPKREGLPLIVSVVGGSSVKLLTPTSGPRHPGPYPSSIVSLDLVQSAATCSDTS